MRSTLVLEPTTAFGLLRDSLSSAGWRLVSQAAQPILPGEPEHAIFERGADERAFYTFNPVCTLRVLEVNGGAGAEVMTGVSGVRPDDVEGWLGADDERTRLRGVLATRQMAEPQLMQRVRALRGDPRPTVAAAARRVSDERNGTQPPPDAGSSARVQALAAIELLKAQLTPLVAAVSHDRSGEALSLVRPREDDFAKAFVGGAVEAARRAYADIWKDVFDMRYPDAAQTTISCELSPAGMLATDNELSRRFPGGYRSIAHLLDPHRVWACWKCLRPGASAGMAYDGLVWLDDHWAWFPKPYRALAPEALPADRE